VRETRRARTERGSVAVASSLHGQVSKKKSGLIEKVAQRKRTEAERKQEGRGIDEKVVKAIVPLEPFSLPILLWRSPNALLFSTMYLPIHATTRSVQDLFLLGSKGKRRFLLLLEVQV